MTVNTKNGKITASKGTLCELSLLASMAAEAYETRGLQALTDRARILSATIYEALDARGYFDDVKEK